MPMTTPSSRRPSRPSIISQTILLDLQVSCRNLPSKSIQQADPFVVIHKVETLSIKVPPRNPLVNETLIGRSEVVLSCSNPDFIISFRVDYKFEEDERLCLRCYSEVAKDSTNLRKHDYIGGCFFTIAQLLGAKGNAIALPLQRDRAYCIIQTKPTRDSSNVLRYQLRGNRLKKDGFFGKKASNPYYVIKRIGPDRKTWNTVHTSPVIMGNQDPQWEIEEIGIQGLTNGGDYSRMIRIDVMNLRQDGKSDDVGGTLVSVNELLCAPNTFEILRTGRSGENKPAGTLSVLSADILNRPTIVDYLVGGCELNLMVAVDFTLSNGHPTDPKSLHYRQEKRMNEYQQAMLKIGKLVQNYAQNMTFPIWAFGAKIDHIKRDCLPLGKPGGHTGVKGLLEAYETAFDIPGFGLSGPTNFSPVLREAAAEAVKANTYRANPCYSILVVLTDGIVTDLEETVDTIVEISQSSPLSIVVIGVGKADFRKMVLLDGDNGILRNSFGEPAERDIVQFVPYRQYASNVDKLALEVLREIPRQFVGYFHLRNIKPNPPSCISNFEEEEVFLDVDQKAEEKINRFAI